MSRQCPLCGENKPEEALFCKDCEKKIRTDYEVELPVSRNEKGVPVPGNKSVAEDVLFPNEKPVANDKPVLSASEETAITEKAEGASTLSVAGAEQRIDSSVAKTNGPLVVDGDNMSDTPKADNDDKVEPAHQPRKKKAGKTFLGITLSVVLLVVAFFVYNETIRKDNLDRSSWDAALSVNSVEGYLTYMTLHPRGAHFEEAQAKLMSLKADEAADWEILKATDNISALRDFLQQHPESPYSSLVRIRLDSLTWMGALKTNTAASYSDYILLAESGDFKGEYHTMAETRYEMLFQSYPVDEAVLDSIRRTVNGFYAALSTVDHDGIRRYLAPAVTRFFDSDSATRERIIGELLLTAARTQEATLQFAPELNSVQYEKTLSDAYKVNVPLTKSYVKEGVVEQVPAYIVHLELNPIFQIISIYETKPYPGAP
ncbi:MAG: hypothetical protein ABFC30_00245 [Proteiniphilum sp.]